MNKEDFNGNCYFFILFFVGIVFVVCLVLICSFLFLFVGKVDGGMFF